MSTAANAMAIDVALARQEMAQNSNLINKLDVAIEKITETNHNITKMLVIHEERIERIEKTGQETSNLVERRGNQVREEIDHMQKGISQKIDDSEARVKSSISELKTDIKNDLKNHKDDNISETKSLKTRIEALEKWRWIITGSSMAIAVLLSKIDLFAKVTKIFVQ